MLLCALYSLLLQCIPSPMAWYAHQLPEWVQKLSVVGTYLIEMAMPFLFFLPVRSLRLLGFASQVSMVIQNLHNRMESRSKSSLYSALIILLTEIFMGSVPLVRV